MTVSFWVIQSQLSHPESTPILYLERFQWAYRGKSPFMEWTPDVDKAMRFCREQDAKAAMVDHHKYVLFREEKDNKEHIPFRTYLESDAHIEEIAS